jgi:hypothetical protein
MKAYGLEKKCLYSYNILIHSGIPKKLATLIKMCL